MRRIKLDQAGFDHVFLGVVIAVVIGIIGTYALVVSRAATNPTTIVGAGSKCLDNFANLKKNGNKIDLYTCNGTDAQKWTVNTNGTIVNGNGYCLNATG